jgi:hypothetical protein
MLLLGDATAALLVIRLASTTGFKCFDLQGNALLMILGVNQLHLFFFLAVCHYCV